MDEPASPHPESSDELLPGIRLPRNAMRFAFARSRGPGGQAVNKLNTAVQLWVRIGDIEGLDEGARGRLRRLGGQRVTRDDELLLRCDLHRSQLDNRRACVARLCRLIDEARREPKPRRPTRPSRAMIERRLAEKKRRAEKKRWRRQKWERE